MRFTFVAVLIVISVFFAGCQSQTASSETADTPAVKVTVIEKEPAPEPPADSVLMTSANLSRIAGLQWSLHTIIDDGQNVPLAELKPYIKFSYQGKVNGSTSVNIFMGSLEIDADGLLKWSPLNSTRMAGSADRMKQEAAFMKILPTTTRMILDSGNLKLFDADGNAVLVFQAKAN